MKKIVIGIIPLIIFIIGCAGSARSRNSDDISLDDAVTNSAQFIKNRLPAKTRIAVLTIASPTNELSQYIYDELVASLLETGSFTLIDRKEIDLIRNELKLQISGEVSDDSMQSVGKMLGAQYIVTGSFTDMDDFFRLVIRVLNVETAAVEMQYRVNIDGDDDVVWTLIEG